MPSIELSDDDLIFLRFLIANLLLKAMQDESHESITKIVSVNEALKNAKY